MLSKAHRIRLKKVCKVLFPKYKYVTIDIINKVATFKNCKIPIVSWFFPKWRVSLTELINFQIPRQLADFKYGNTTFISVIQQDLVKCNLAKQNEIDYFFVEITKIKYADLYKALNITPEDVDLSIVPDEEDEMFEEMTRFYGDEKNDKKVQYVKPFWATYEFLFYTLLLVIVTYVLLTRL